MGAKTNKQMGIHRRLLKVKMPLTTSSYGNIGNGKEGLHTSMSTGGRGRKISKHRFSHLLWIDIKDLQLTHLEQRHIHTDHRVRPTIRDCFEKTREILTSVSRIRLDCTSEDQVPKSRWIIISTFDYKCILNHIEGGLRWHSVLHWRKSEEQHTEGRGQD